MPYFKTSQEWLHQSTLLLEARPTTTRITTRYSIKPAKPRKTDPDGSDNPPNPAPAARGSLVIKTYDPTSGVTLKYRTTKAAEVSRLIYTSLGTLGRGMAALPAVEEGAIEASTVAESSGTKMAQAPAPQLQQQQQQGQGQGQQAGGGKKKKKGRK